MVGKFGKLSAMSPLANKIWQIAVWSVPHAINFCNNYGNLYSYI